MKRIVAAICLLGCALSAPAQEAGVFAWQDIGKRLKASQAISPLGSNVSGEQVSLSNGALSFSATDVSLPGNNGLDVSFSRSYTVRSRKEYYADEMLADWSVSVPHIWGVFTTNWDAPGASPGDRCSNTAPPTRPGGGGYLYSDYWVGLTIELPGGGGGDLLNARTDISLTKPTTGGPYPRLTDDGTTFVACLPSIKNGTGQGFIATMSDGTRVWYDWMAQYKEPRLKGNQVDVGSGGSPIYSYQERRRNYLFATRVEDRFGNYVEYTYTNAWNAPGKLTKILANDGRQITLNYTSGYVTSVSDGTRTWSYGYNNTGRGRKTLSSVTLPDTSTWAIGFSAFTDAEIKYNEAAFDEPLRSCTMVEPPLNGPDTSQPVGTVTHPSGAKGTFTVDIQEHGRSSVTVACGHVQGEPPGYENNPNDDVNTWAISDLSFTLKQKRISGPGVTTAEWNYYYAPGISVYRYPGTTRLYPVCYWGTQPCATPPCQSEDCAGASMTTIVGPNGDWTRYTYGNTFRYDEGKLRQVESGAAGSSVALKKVVHTYDLDQTDKVYPASYGSSLKPDWDGFASQYHRPLTKTETDQEAIRFKYQINNFDVFARPMSVTRSSGPAPAP